MHYHAIRLDPCSTTFITSVSCIHQAALRVFSGLKKKDPVKKRHVGDPKIAVSANPRESLRGALLKVAFKAFGCLRARRNRFDAS